MTKKKMNGNYAVRMRKEKKNGFVVLRQYWVRVVRM